MTKKLKQLFVDYGSIAVVIHFSIFFLTWGGFFIAISAGLDLQDVNWLPSIVEKGGNAAISYVLTQAVKPIRIGLTIVLTPLVGAHIRKRKEAANEIKTESLVMDDSTE